MTTGASARARSRSATLPSVSTASRSAWTTASRKPVRPALTRPSSSRTCRSAMLVWWPTKCPPMDSPKTRVAVAGGGCDSSSEISRVRLARTSATSCWLT